MYTRTDIQLKTEIQYLFLTSSLLFYYNAYKIPYVDKDIENTIFYLKDLMVHKDNKENIMKQTRILLVVKFLSSNTLISF